jgi:malate permease and related proteins
LFFFYIALNVILPIFLVMSLGYFLSKYFTLDLGSLSKLNFYIFIPVFMFYSLLIFKPGNREISMTILFNLLFSVLTFLVMYGITRYFKFEPGLAASSTLAVMIFNSANYGIPVVQLAFQGEGVAIQVITITAMNVITYTLGVLIIGGWNEWKKGVWTILKLPILYALALALLIRGLDINLPDALMTPLKWVADGMMPIALLTLGAQLGKAGISLKHPKQLWITVWARLLLCPLLAFLLIHAMGLQGLVARVLFVSSAFPTAVATVLFGIEYDKEPTFAADVVAITTLLSAVTVAGAISLSSVLF